MHNYLHYRVHAHFVYDLGSLTQIPSDPQKQVPPPRSLHADAQIAITRTRYFRFVFYVTHYCLDNIAA